LCAERVPVFFHRTGLGQPAPPRHRGAQLTRPGTVIDEISMPISFAPTSFLGHPLAVVLATVAQSCWV
jgi:hypothetical protein